MSAHGPKVKWRVVQNELQDDAAFVCWDRGPVCGTRAPQPWDEDAARVRYIANHSVFFFAMPTKLAEKLVADWNASEDWNGWTAS